MKISSKLCSIAIHLEACQSKNNLDIGWKCEHTRVLESLQQHQQKTDAEKKERKKESKHPPFGNQGYNAYFNRNRAYLFGVHFPVTLYYYYCIFFLNFDRPIFIAY